MDRDFLDSLSCQLHGNPTAESPRATSDECCVERYPHSADLLHQLVSVVFVSVPLALIAEAQALLEAEATQDRRL
jgi:hypothetical protein